MPLQALPIEIVCMIFRVVGSQQLLKTILVCKWWHNIAVPIALEDIVLSADSLIALPKEAHVKIATYVRRISIVLYGAGDELAKHNRKLSEKTPTNVEWSDALVHRLVKFRELLPQCNSLDFFSLSLRTPWNPSNPMAIPDDYLSLWSPTKLIDVFQATNLSHLVIDTCGSEIQDHACPAIALEISSLRSIRLRMRKICPRVLSLQATQDSRQNALAQSAHEQRKEPVALAKLESIIINLSRIDNGRRSTAYSQHCTETKRGWELFDDMVIAASETANEFPTLQVVRVLCHKHPWTRMVSKDCISGTKMLISDDIDGDWDWSDDGPIDPDEVRSSPESEINDDWVNT